MRDSAWSERYFLLLGFHKGCRGAFLVPQTSAWCRFSGRAKTVSFLALWRCVLRWAQLWEEAVSEPSAPVGVCFTC